MPYIPPALSPSKSLASLSYPSPPSSNPNSPPGANSALHPTTTNGDAERSSTSTNVPPFSSGYSDGFPKRPTRHHSRSHSSDTLVSISNEGRSSSYPRASKCTPDFIFVHPASPGPNERHQYSFHPSRPALRPAHAHRTSSSSTVGAGDSGDVAPPRSSRRNSASKKFQISASADSSPRGSISLESGKTFNLQLPDMDAMTPPAFANRSSSSPAISSLDDTPPAYTYSARARSPDYHSYAYSPLSSPKKSPTMEARQAPASVKSTDLRPEDSALASSSESMSTQDSSSSSESELSILPKSMRNKLSPSWGDVGSGSATPTPTMGSETSFQFASSGGSSSSTPTPTATSTPTVEGTEPKLALPPPTSSAEYPSPSGSENESQAPLSLPNGAAVKPRRPVAGHAKALSERAIDRPASLNLDMDRTERQSDFAHDQGHHLHHYPQPQAGHGHHHQYYHTHSGAPSGVSSRKRTPLPTPMLRKKSGELVKSSLKHEHSTSNTLPSASFRAKSLPTTPTGPKAVHFDEQLERVKLFLAQQRPTAVSRDGSPIETETEDDSEAAFPFPPMTTSIPSQIALVMPEFPHNSLPEIGHRDVCLETLEIAADSKSLKGTALLRNLAFEKRLSVRFTLDDWQTISEVTGEWTSTLVGGTIDRWSFNIKLQDLLARIDEKTMYVALKYTVNGTDLWDSNNGKNYKVEFRKLPARSQAVVGGSRAARHEWSVTNPGQASERMADLRRELDRLVADQDDFGSSDEIVLTSNRNSFRYSPKFVGDEAVPLAQAPSSNTFSSRYDFGASLKNAPHRNSPQTSHAILDNPYFASPASDALPIKPWRTGSSLPSTINPMANLPVTSVSPFTASALSPPPSNSSSNNSSLDNSPPRPQFSSLYADGGADVASSIIGNTAMPPVTAPLNLGGPSVSTPPASFSGSSYYPRTEANGVISTDFGLPNYMSNALAGLGAMSVGDTTIRPPSPPADDVSLQAFQQSFFMNGSGPVSSAEASETPAGELIGGAPLSRQSQLSNFPSARHPLIHDSNSASQESLSSISLHSLDPSLDDQDPLDPSIYSPANTSPASLSPTRRASPPIRPASPEDLLSPSPSSASTDTSISTPQSPNGSPPLRRYSPYINNDSLRPDMGSDTYFNFVHRYCWGNGDLVSPSSTSSLSSNSASTALGLAGLTSYEASTPRRATPPSSCSASLLSSPAGSNAGSRTPSPRNGSPTVETVTRMEKTGFMFGPPSVQT